MRIANAQGQLSFVGRGGCPDVIVTPTAAGFVKDNPTETAALDNVELALRAAGRWVGQLA